MRAFAILLAIGACNTARGVPWLHGLDRVVSSTGIVAPHAPPDEIADDCGVAASRPIELVADVAPGAGRETIVASYSSGVTVFDSEDHVVAELPGTPCQGTADELDAVAVGHAYGDTLLVIVATSGGHRETETSLSLVRAGATLDPVFTAVVATRTNDRTIDGAIYLFPGGLLYQRPGGELVPWRVDPGSGIYVPLLPERHEEPRVARR